MVVCCSICLNELQSAAPESNDHRVCVVKCGHAFHFVCIKEWYHTNCREKYPGDEFRETIIPICCPNCQQLQLPLLFEIRLNLDSISEADVLSQPSIADLECACVANAANISSFDAEIKALRNGLLDLERQHGEDVKVTKIFLELKDELEHGGPEALVNANTNKIGSSSQSAEASSP